MLTKQDFLVMRANSRIVQTSWTGSRPPAVGSYTGTAHGFSEFSPCQEPLVSTNAKANITHTIALRTPRRTISLTFLSPQVITTSNPTWAASRRCRSRIERRRTTVWSWRVTVCGTLCPMKRRVGWRVCVFEGRPTRSRVRRWRMKRLRRRHPTRPARTRRCCWRSWRWLGTVLITLAWSWWTSEGTRNHTPWIIVGFFFYMYIF